MFASEEVNVEVMHRKLSACSCLDKKENIGTNYNIKVANKSFKNGAKFRYFGMRPTYLLTYLPTYLLTYSLTHSLTYLITHLFTYLLTHSLTHLLTHLITHSLTHSLTYLFTHSITHSLTYLLTSYLLTDSLTHSFTHSVTYLLTHSLTPWSRVLLEKLTGFAVSQEIPRIYGTRKFITVLTSACHLSLS
jgi:hypothetical protein